MKPGKVGYCRKCTFLFKRSFEILIQKNLGVTFKIMRKYPEIIVKLLNNCLIHCYRKLVSMLQRTNSMTSFVRLM